VLQFGTRGYERTDEEETSPTEIVRSIGPSCGRGSQPFQTFRPHSPVEVHSQRIQSRLQIDHRRRICDQDAVYRREDHQGADLGHRQVARRKLFTPHSSNTDHSRSREIPCDHFCVRPVQRNGTRELIQAHRKLTLTAQLLSRGCRSAARI